ncbi:MAG: SDR family NAD(P)-dependent oxidoreductase [Chloroflexi bacterium]|nr:SDR family NAD(P)-dependent oxidoreductase [Chloroflexota bacterium]MCY4246439.1 SDR family NAD(P)-dependent oxidoreductase [Chloroflexota bacterium]
MTQRCALITGAGSGMGRAIGLRLAAAGMQVRLAGRTESKLRAVADEIAAVGGSARVHALDLEDDNALAGLANALAGTRLDALVNCAGDWLIAPLEATADAQFDHLLRLNLRAPYVLTRLLLPNLRRSDNASILNIGSIVTALSVPAVSAYTASKVGLKGITGALAAELREELIRVVMISPGPADTPMRAAASPGIDRSLLVDPQTIAEVAHAVLSLPRGITTSDFTLHSLRWG